MTVGRLLCRHTEPEGLAAKDLLGQKHGIIRNDILEQRALNFFKVLLFELPIFGKRGDSSVKHPVAETVKMFLPTT